MCKLLTYVLFLSCTVCCFGAHKSSIHSLLTQIAEKVSERHVDFGKDAGTYRNKICFHAPPSMASHVAQKACYDNTIFTTFWTVIPLLDASKYSGTPFVTSQQLLSTLNVIRKAYDRNRPYNNSLVNFYVQTYNAEKDFWMNVESTTCDVDQSERVYLSEDEIRRHLQEKGFEGADAMAKAITYRTFRENLTINPTDFDDSSSNLFLGSILEEMKEMFPESRRYWLDANCNLTSYLEAVKKYAYRPFVSDVRNAIAPKSYYVLRHFLHEAEENGDDVGITAVWMTNELDPHWTWSQGADDVDLIVCVRTLNAITAAILSGVLPTKTLDDPELKMIYLNTTRLISYLIQSNFSGRVDLALDYYTAVNQLYSFASRILSVIESFKLRENLPHPAVVEFYDTMKHVLKGHATDEIISLVKSSDKSDEIYFDGVLGNLSAGTDVDDRVYTTAITLNALVNIWSVYDSDNKTLSWISDTPSKVRQTATAGCKWLEKNILGNKYKHKNAFFTGTGTQYYNYWFPKTRLEFPNGTKVNEDMGIPEEFYFGAVEGVVPEEQYEAMLNEKHFGVKTPQEFCGVEELFYTYWSCEAMTYSSALLALTQCSLLEE